MSNSKQWSWLWSAFLFFGLICETHSQELEDIPLQKTESGLKYQVLKEGTGKTPTASDDVTVSYTGYLLNGSKFDSKNRIEIKLNQMIPGWQQAVSLMKVGAQCRFTIPSKLAYGEKGNNSHKIKIPANAVLIYDIELHGINRTEINRVMAQIDDELITWVDLYTRGGTLDDLIKNKLILNALKKINQQISKAEIEQGVESHVQQKFAGDRTKFVDHITEKGISFERFSETIEEKLALAKLIEKNYFKTPKPNTETTAQDRQIAYQQIINEYAKKQTVSLSIIAITKDRYAKQKGPEVSLRETANEIKLNHKTLSKIAPPKIGTIGNSLAIAPDDTELVNKFESLGGKPLEKIKPSNLSSEVNRVVRQLKPGEISEVFDDGLSLKIVLLKSRTTPQAPTSEELSSKIAQLAIDRKWQKYYKDIILNLRNDSTIKIYE